jgi:hypothetical protein
MNVEKQRRLSTLLLALAVLPPLAFQSQGDLSLYLATAAHYASGSRAAALREIQRWGPSEISKATAALRQKQTSFDRW